MADLNHRPSGLESDALPTELIDHHAECAPTKYTKKTKVAHNTKANTHALAIAAIQPAPPPYLELGQSLCLILEP